MLAPASFGVKRNPSSDIAPETRFHQYTYSRSAAYSPNEMPTTSPTSTHPLLYASPIPINESRGVPRIDLHKPKAVYSVGRNPQSDVVLDWRIVGECAGGLQ